MPAKQQGMEKREIESAPDDAEEFVHPVQRDGRFWNPWPGPECPSTDPTRGGQHVPYSNEELKWLQPVLEPIFHHPGDKDHTLRATWLGEGTVWLNMEGLSVLFDPVLVDTVAQSDCPDHPRLHRLRRPPCLVEEIPKLDAVVISNSAYTHLDLDTCGRIVSHFGSNVPFFVPLGVANLLTPYTHNVIEMSWWQKTTLKEGHGAAIICLPAQHWTAHSPTDINKTLWASWAILGEEEKVMYVGDTGYCPVFKTIGKHYGPFDLAFIPIGGYVPRSELRHWKVNPAEALEIHRDLQAVQSIAINWGTWFYGLGKSEHYMEPSAFLREQGDQKGLTDEFRRVVDFIHLWLGQSWSAAEHGLDGCLLSNPTD